MKERIIALAKEFENEIIDYRRYLHSVPELGFDLPLTTTFVREKLEDMGYDVKNCGKSGLTCIVGTGEAPVLLMRADMDALPSPENANLPFKGTNGNGHLCGHDMHTSQLLGAAKILKEIESDLKGTVKFMFQPNEEEGFGAQDMIEAGIMENPKVDAAIGFHVMSDQDKGKVFYTKKYFSASADRFFLKVHGKSAHGSQPEKGIDPLFVVANIYMQLSGIKQREATMFDNAVFSIGLMGGGEACNIIPETARLEGTLRCYKEEIRVNKVLNLLVKPMMQLTKLATLEILLSMNNEELCDEFNPYITEIFGEGNVIETNTPLTGSEDFSYVSELVPSFFATLGTGKPGDYPVHNANVVFDESNIANTSAAFANVAINFFNKRA